MNPAHPPVSFQNNNSFLRAEPLAQQQMPTIDFPKCTISFFGQSAQRIAKLSGKRREKLLFLQRAALMTQ
jgi:hypothetical protein